MKRVLILALSFVVTMGAQRAMAWGTVGHHCAAYIAEQHLTPEAKEKTRYYLQHTLSYYAMWMDRWRGIKEFEAINNGHSVRTTDDGRKISWEALTSSTMGNAVPTPPGRAMGHLLSAMNELGNGKYKELPDSVVRQRLINMIHYVPDMHCPVHVSISKKTFPQYTQKKGVFRDGKSMKFHTLWDAAPAMDRKGWDIDDYAKAVDKVSRKQAKAWQSGTLVEWGRDIAQGGHLGYQLLPDGTDVTKMGKKEKKAMMEHCDKMAMMGAYRLAYVLNTIFADKTIKTK